MLRSVLDYVLVNYSFRDKFSFLFVFVKIFYWNMVIFSYLYIVYDFFVL